MTERDLYIQKRLGRGLLLSGLVHDVVMCGICGDFMFALSQKTHELERD